MGAAVTLYLLLYGGVSFLGGLFATADFRSVLRVLGLNVLLVSLLVVPSAVLRRRLELRVLALSRLGAVVIGAVVAIPMALAGYGYWALVGQSLVAYVTQAAAAFWFSRWRPRIAFGPDGLAPVLRFSLPASLHISINYWARNMGSLLIARFAGAAPLGEFNLAQRVLTIPVQLLGSALGPTLHPTFAIIGSDLPRLRSAYGHFVQLAGIVSLSVAAVLYLTADPLVPLLWGPQWTASVGLVYALLPAAAVQPIVAISGPLYLARNRPGLMVGVGLFNALVILAGITLGLRWGTWGLAWGYSLAYVCLAAPCAALVAQRQLLRAPVGDLARWLFRPVAAGAMVLTAGWASRLLSTTAPPVLALATIVAGSLVGFFCALRVIAWPLVLSALRARAGVPAPYVP
jgi:PST family polysaccharide transporter